MEENKQRVSYWDTDLTRKGNSVFELLGIQFLDEMAEKTARDIYALRSIGKSTVQELRRVLGKYGYCLKGDILVNSEEERKVLTDIPDLLNGFLRQLHEIDTKMNWMRKQFEMMIDSRKNLEVK